MVVCSVPSLGQRRPVCPARLYLSAAQRALKNNDVLSAGVRMRTAAIYYLEALCESHQITPKEFPDRMAKQLLDASQLDECGHQWIVEMIEVGDRCACCKHVRLSLVETCISLLHLLIDNSPEISFPTRGGAV